MKKPRTFGPDYITIGEQTIRFDAADYTVVSQHSWVIATHKKRHWDLCYAKTKVGKRRVGMSDVILGPPPAGCLWDHISGDGLDNRRTNLRPATRTVNIHNSGGTAKSGYKGVYAHSGSWRTMVRTENGLTRLGSYTTAIQAAWAYDVWCLANRPWARLNFPGQPTPVLQVPLNRQTGQLHRKHKNAFRGVGQCPDRKGKWKAQIKIDNVPHHLGRFDSPEAAARAYDVAALAAWGALAPLNFPSCEGANSNT